MFEELVSTQLRQGHLCPMSLDDQPVFWEFDHALSLYPVPQAFVMADRTEAAQTTYEDLTTCMNPGTFGRDGTFVCYLPNDEDMSVEISQIDDM